MQAANSENQLKKKRKPRGRPFKPGQSGNPKGRPSTPQEIKDFIENQTLPSLENLIKIRDDKNVAAKTRSAISEYIINRRLGMPSQTIDATVTEKKFILSLPPELKDV